VDNKEVNVRYPTSLDEENELLLASLLQLVTVAWTKLTRRILKKGK